MTAPDATAGDGLRAQIEDRLWRYWENGVPDWAVEDILALPALRDVLAAAARDAEKVRRVEELHTPDDGLTGEKHCRGCATHITFTRWPCATIWALDPS